LRVEVSVELLPTPLSPTCSRRSGLQTIPRSTRSSASTRSTTEIPGLPTLSEQVRL